MDESAEVRAALRQWMRTHHGLVTRADAVQLGATRAMIRGQVERGEWELVFTGCIGTQHAPGQRTRPC